MGAGIVADSDPEFEYSETLHKAAATLEALEAYSAEKVCIGEEVCLST